ncbi:amidohydrolase [Leucobacter sp. GX24907]
MPDSIADMGAAAGTETAETAETVLRARAALTPQGAIADAEVAFGADGVITYVGAHRPETEGPRDLGERLLIPGLVNGHTHSAMTLQRGVSDDEGFMPWLAAVQAIEQHLTRDDIEAGLQLAMLEMIETGTTAFADMYFWDEALLECVRHAGMRVLAAPASFTPEAVGFPSASPMTGAEVTDLTEQLAERFRGDAQIRIAYGPHAPYTCPPEFLSDIAARSLRLQIPIHTHVSESPAEIVQIGERYGATPADHLASLGLFDTALLAAHCVHLTESEIELFARTGASASHNPVSNLKLGNGIAPLPEMLAAGVRLTLGTDGVASNNTLDLFEEIKTATILHRGSREDPAVVRAADVLDIATARGAEAIGFPETGALEVGKQADIVALDVSGTSAAQFIALPLSTAGLVSHLAFTARGSDVRDVFIGGRQVYADGRHLTLDADAVRERARAATARVRGAAGV